MPAEQPATVLVIDDNPRNLQVASEHLARYGYVVLTARDGERGLRRAQYTGPDLVLLDIAMPGVDGFETCRRLQAHPATCDIPVLFMTASHAHEDKLRAFDLGGVDYVTKPFEAGELLARVRTHLTLAAQRRQLAAQAALLDERLVETTTRYQQETGRLQDTLAERERLVRVIALQSAQLEGLTRRWLESGKGAGVAASEHLRQTHLERLRLVAGELALAEAKVADGDGAQHIERARALLEPVLGEVSPAADDLLADTEHLDDPMVKLSAREREVFDMLVLGKANKEIAWALGLKPTTVSTYRLRVLEKLGVEDVPALVRLSLSWDTGGVPD